MGYVVLGSRVDLILLDFGVKLTHPSFSYEDVLSAACVEFVVDVGMCWLQAFRRWTLEKDMLLL